MAHMEIGVVQRSAVVGQIEPRKYVHAPCPCRFLGSNHFPTKMIHKKYSSIRGWRCKTRTKTKTKNVNMGDRRHDW